MMAETPSSMLPLGTKAPAFQLVDVLSNKQISLASVKDAKATVIMFICNHCPYVKHIMAKVVALAKHYQALNVSFIAINSNDIIAYPEDDETHMRTFAQHYAMNFPYLLDHEQSVAKAYQAACTPDFYLFNHDLICVYRGRFDAATPKNNQAVTGNDLSQAIDAVLTNKSIAPQQLPSLGCNIKWKKSANPSA